LLLLGSLLGVLVILVGICGLLSIIAGYRVAILSLDERFFAIMGAVWLISTGCRAVRQAWDLERIRKKDQNA
jgi:uncharacterized membrane protein